MLRRLNICVALGVLMAAVPAQAQRAWIVYPSFFEGAFLEHPTGEFDGGGQFGGGYKYYTTDSFDGVRRGYWDLTNDNIVPVAPNTDPFPSKAAQYFIEQWVPSSTPAGVTWDINAFWNELPIEVTYQGPGSDEEATNNLAIPWGGQFGTNHQWIKMELNQPEGTWRQAGPGPQSPASDTCSATGQTGNRVWLKRGASLYTKWNFLPPPPAHAITALRITEVVPFTQTCDSATQGGPVDLRCLGNADPLYEQGEPFHGTRDNKPFPGAEAVTIDGDAALAVESFTIGTCIEPQFPFNVPLTPGLPASGTYTAQLPDGNVNFQFRFDGLNSIKWKTEGVPDIGGEFDETRVFTLNETPEQEFLVGNYSRLYLLSVTSGQSAGTIDVEAVYDDQSSDQLSANLYDWFGQDGDATSIPVGVQGKRKDQTNAIGFSRVDGKGVSLDAGGGNADGAWLMAHIVEIDGCKTLEQIKLSLSAGASGRVQVLALTLEGGGCACSTPVFDIAGGGPDLTEPDGSVDQTDFAYFQRCLTGSNPAPGLFDEENCACLDVDGNEAIDDDDFQFFLACATGPASGTPPPAGCDQP